MRNFLLTTFALIALTTAAFAHGHGGGGHGGGGHVRVSLIAVPTYTERIIVIHRARCEGLNVQVTMPSDAWKRIDPQAIGSHTNFMITRHNPEITISLAGERVGIEANDSNHTLLIASQTKMKSLPGAAILPGQHPLAAQNIEGIAYQASAEQDGKTAHYAMWVASHNGFNYKLAVFGEQKYKPMIEATMRNFLSGMRQLDNQRIAHAEKKVKTADLYTDVAEKADLKEPQPFEAQLVK